MSKLHNGHYIASKLSPYLTMILAKLASIPWESGVSLAHWRKSLNVALEKAKGMRLLSKMCTIHLLEADFNTGTKLFLLNIWWHMLTSMGRSQNLNTHASTLKKLRIFLWNAYTFTIHKYIKSLELSFQMILKVALTAWCCLSAPLLFDGLAFPGKQCAPYLICYRTWDIISKQNMTTPIDIMKAIKRNRSKGGTRQWICWPNVNYYQRHYIVNYSNGTV